MRRRDASVDHPNYRFAMIALAVASIGFLLLGIWGVVPLWVGIGLAAAAVVMLGNWVWKRPERGPNSP